MALLAILKVTAFNKRKVLSWPMIRLDGASGPGENSLINLTVY